MRITLSWAGVCLLGGLPWLSFYARPGQARPESVTLVVQHVECTTCQDLTVDSGTVRIPAHLRQEFIDNQLKYRRPWELKLSRGQLLDAYTRRQYAVTELTLHNEAVFDSLFAVPGRTIELYEGSGPISYPWAFDRRYRVTGQVIAIQGKYPVFNIQRAVLVRPAK